MTCVAGVLMCYCGLCAGVPLWTVCWCAIVDCVLVCHYMDCSGVQLHCGLCVDVSLWTVCRCVIVDCVLVCHCGLCAGVSSWTVVGVPSWTVC